MSAEPYKVIKPGFILGNHYSKGAMVDLVPAQARSFIKSGHVEKVEQKKREPRAEDQKPTGKKAD